MKMILLSNWKRAGRAFFIGGFFCSSVFSLSADDDMSGLLLSDEAVPWEELGKDFPKRPRPVTEVIEDTLFPENRERIRIIDLAHETENSTLLETAPERRNIFGGNPFLSSGPLAEGFEIPTGAVWQPVFLAYGEARTAVQTFDNGFGNTTEIASRIDLFGNLYLTPTERILVGFRPLDRDGGFTGYQFEGANEGFYESLSARVQTLFFEGDFGELFPRLDPTDFRHFDWGFAFGRQPLNFQDGILINDSIDSIGISRASLFKLGANAARVTYLAGFNQIHRGDNRRDPDAFIYAVLGSLDYDKNTIELDLVYVDGDSTRGGDGIYAGIGDTRRIGEWNSTVRLNGSHAFGNGTAEVDSGFVFTSQLSRTMTYNDDIFYLDSFYGNGNFTSAARDPSVGGPLGTIGILYAATGLGDYGAPLGNQVGESLGFAVGYQHFLSDSKDSLISEIGGRIALDGAGENSIGAALRYQKAFGQHYILQLDGFVAAYDDDLRPLRDDVGVGLRCEWRVKF